MENESNCDICTEKYTPEKRGFNFTFKLSPRNPKEAERLGYNKIIISSNSKTQNKTNQIEILKFSKLSDVVKEVFKEQD